MDLYLIKRYVLTHILINRSQLAKMKKSIPDISLP